MTTAADIIKQYGRVLARESAPLQDEYLDIESDMMTLALIVSDYGNNPLPYDEAEITRDNLELCLAGKNHRWTECDQHNCHKGNQ